MNKNVLETECVYIAGGKRSVQKLQTQLISLE